MARYTGPLCKLCRREGMALYLKGERCYTEKCSFKKRSFAPGQHGKTMGKKKTTQYGLQLRSKQAMKRTYGVLEKQFRLYFEQARKKKGITGENLVQIVESRLDNAIFRMGFALSRPQARQLVLHGHVKVNGRKVNIPSYRLRPEDIVEIHEKARSIPGLREAVEAFRDKGVVPWMEVDYDQFRATFVRLPNLDEVGLPVDVQSIVELYSK